MDIDVVKTLLDCQDKAYKSALEIFLNQVNEKVQSCEKAVNDLTRSLEFSQSEVDGLRGEVNQLKRDKQNTNEKINTLYDELQAKGEKIKELEEKSVYQEDYSRRNNLQISGLPEHPRETWEKTAEEVSKLLERQLQLPRMELERAHRFGVQREHQGRPVIVRFARFSDREAVLRNCSKLRGTNIFINEDLSPTSQAIKREKMPLLRQARSEGKIAYFRHTRLIVKERPGATGGDGDGARGGSVNEDPLVTTDNTAVTTADSSDGDEGAAAVYSGVAATTSTAASDDGVYKSATFAAAVAANAAVRAVTPGAGGKQQMQTRKGKPKKQ